jgi:hypothetical protein
VELHDINSTEIHIRVPFGLEKLRDFVRYCSGTGQVVIGSLSGSCQRSGYAVGMTDVSQLLDAAASGDPQAATELLPLVYDELRKLAAARLTGEKLGHTFQPTARGSGTRHPGLRADRVEKPAWHRRFGRRPRRGGRLQQGGGVPA